MTTATRRITSSKLAYCEQHLRDLAAAPFLAQEQFESDIVEQFGFSEAESRVIFTTYLAYKAIKFDFGNRRYELSHGALWERESMLNALAIAAQTKKTVFIPTIKRDGRYIVLTEKGGVLVAAKNLTELKSAIGDVEAYMNCKTESDAKSRATSTATANGFAAGSYTIHAIKVSV